MKKRNLFSICILLTLILLIPLCGNNTLYAKNNNEQSIDGVWTDDTKIIAVDGSFGYLDCDDTIYKCLVDTKKQTITIKKYSWDDSDVIYSYDLINNKLVLDTDNEESMDDTLSFSHSDEALVDSQDLKIDGEWKRSHSTLSIDGKKGVLDWEGQPYKCSINTKKKILTIKKFSWDDSDSAYDYNLINGKLLINTDNKEALIDTMLLEVSDEADTEKNVSEQDNLDETEESSNIQEISDSVFSPQDVSDKTIESINTYGDYLIMYRKIIDDYLSNYESALQGTLLYSESTFQEMKDDVDKSFAEQENEYGSMKNKQIVGKSHLVDFLKNYRDSLKEYTDSLADSLNALQ